MLYLLLGVWGNELNFINKLLNECSASHKETIIVRQLAWRLGEQMRSVELSELVKRNDQPRLTNVCLCPQIKTVIFAALRESLDVQLDLC